MARAMQHHGGGDGMAKAVTPKQATTERLANAPGRAASLRTAGTQLRKPQYSLASLIQAKEDGHITNREFKLWMPKLFDLW